MIPQRGIMGDFCFGECAPGDLTNDEKETNKPATNRQAKRAQFCN